MMENKPKKNEEIEMTEEPKASPPFPWRWLVGGAALILLLLWLAAGFCSVFYLRELDRKKPPQPTIEEMWEELERKEGREPWTEDQP